jgi:hypothetical protein
MKKLFFFFLINTPFQAFPQNEVPPEGGKLLWFLAILISLPLIYYLLRSRVFSKEKIKGKPGPLFMRRLKIELTKDREYRPNVLTLKIFNNSRRDIDLQAPVLLFRKLWSKRKFKLKGINRYEIYPLYLEAGKVHELRIDLSVFYSHDKKLRRFYWTKIRVADTKGKEYSSRYVTMRKSLFS